MAMFNRIRDSHNHLLTFFLFLICAAVLLYFYPKEARFKFEFQEDQPWLYDDLYAPYDFEEFRLEGEIEAEKENIRKTITPIYVRDTSIGNQALSNFKFSIQKILKDELNQEEIQKEIREGVARLDDIFKIGVIDLDPLHESQPATFELNIVSGNVARTVQLGDLLTMSSATASIEGNLDPRSQKTLKESINYNLKYDAERTNEFTKGKIDGIQRLMGTVFKGEKIINKGELVGNDQFRKLQSLQLAFENRTKRNKSEWFILLGQTLLIGICLFGAVIVIWLFQREIFEEPKKVSFVLFLLILMAITAKLALDVESLHVYAAPLCILPIIIRAFYDNRLALSLHVISVFMISFIIPGPFEFAFLQIFAGILLLLGITNLNKRSQFFRSALVIFVSYSITYFGLNIVQEGSLESINWQNYSWFAVNALMSLLAYPLIYLFEKIFGLISEASLLELSDTNSPLLRELNEKAPGSFQHTIQVANLAEEAIRAINGNILLVRAGALYHDIGKMVSPEYFIENQHGRNPHDELPNIESAKIILSHVIKGIEIAKKNKLPEEIIDFIRTHHGTTKTEYFLRKEKELVGSDFVDEDQFQYLGPKPFSKETVVVMMADAVEAASKSLKKYDDDSITKLVSAIIDSQLNRGQYDNADISLKEISLIKILFKKKLMNIYHSRIEYPDGTS